MIPYADDGQHDQRDRKLDQVPEPPSRAPVRRGLPRVVDPAAKIPIFDDDEVTP